MMLNFFLIPFSLKKSFEFLKRNAMFKDVVAVVFQLELVLSDSMLG